MGTTENKVVKKICPKCGQLFACVEQDTCWCEGMNVERDMLRKIRICYFDCLCPDCLQEYATPVKR